MSPFRRLLIASLACACSEPQPGRPPSGLETLRLDTVEPAIVLPGTAVEVRGASFVPPPNGRTWLRLDGRFDGRTIDVELPAEFDDFDALHVAMNASTLAAFGADAGEFDGQASVVVDFVPDGTRHLSPPIPVTLEVTQALEPQIESLLDAGAIYVNEPITIEGSGILLGGGEGTTFAVVEGCFASLDGGDCEPIARTKIPVVPEAPHTRDRGHFAFSPAIAGVHPGAFSGEVKLVNEHAEGSETDSETHGVEFDLLETTVKAAGPGGSVGQFIDVEGDGFVGDDGLTSLLFEGTFYIDGREEGVEVADLVVLPVFVSGQLVRYVINEGDALGKALRPFGGARYAAGHFEGTMRASVRYADQELVGPAAPLEFAIEPVKQVTWIRFNASYVESLRVFGLRAMDERIRERVLQVLRRDYDTINVEFRTEEPTDFSLYATVDISGPDPNGLGLLGYDNTAGKDTNNQRLYDTVGGVNAQTELDGYAKYGGVFIESIFTFSHHPPAGIHAEASSALFDTIFDPLRGRPVSSADEANAGIPRLDNGSQCPATDRPTQIACAVWVLGSIIGGTTSHELGHSMGLADPTGAAFHNTGDGPNRLMDKGGARSFEERAEVDGQGPSVFCDTAYHYLRGILPTDEAETNFQRPGC